MASETQDYNVEPLTVTLNDSDYCRTEWIEGDGQSMVHWEKCNISIMKKDANGQWALKEIVESTGQMRVPVGYALFCTAGKVKKGP